MANIFVTEPIPTAKVLLETTAGQILIELWAKEIPKACRNFIQLCLEGYYDGCQFHRVVPGFIVQTGDRTNTGDGGDSIYGDPFEDEFNQRIKFNRRGLVAMANEGQRNTNLSQFFITLDRADSLQGKNTIFGRVVGDTLYNVLKIGESELISDTERPQDPYTIRSVEVIEAFFDDIVPRITAEERREQNKARKEAKQEKKERDGKIKKRGKAIKNKSLMSFEDGEGDDSLRTGTSGLKSLHEAVKEERLDVTSVDDRAFNPNLPPEMFAGDPSANRKRKAKEFEESTTATTVQIKPEVPSTLKKKKTEVVDDEAEKRRKEIATLQASLKKDLGNGSESESDSEKPNKKGKLKSGVSGAALLAAEREKYFKKGARESSKLAKKGARTEDVSRLLDGFKSRLRAAWMTEDVDMDDTPEAKKENQTEDSSMPFQGVVGDLDGDDEGWMSHELKFRKDATVDIHKVTEYDVVDPRARREQLTLNDMRQREEDKRRREMEGRSKHAGRSRK